LEVQASHLDLAKSLYRHLALLLLLLPVRVLQALPADLALTLLALLLEPLLLQAHVHLQDPSGGLDQI
jgi:hypothetical protein